MPWIDVVILILLGFAAVRGFMKGFFIQLAGLVAVVLGIWGAIRFHEKVAGMIGLDPQSHAISFLVTMVLIVVAVHLLSKIITKLMDAVQLGILNKLGGALLGLITSAFLYSVIINVVFAKTEGSWMPAFISTEDSRLIEPLKAFAPLVVPQVASSKWMERAWEKVKESTDVIVNE